MKTKFLLPHRCKRWGLLLVVIFGVLGALNIYFDYNIPFLEIGKKQPGKLFEAFPNNLTDELALTGFVIGLLMVAFSREKIEDEYVGHLRLESLMWSVLLNYVLLIIATWIFYGESYFQVMIYNMFTVLVVFILRFYYMMYWRKEKQEDTL